MELNLKDLEKRFHADGYRLALKAIHAGMTRDAIFSALQEMYSMVDEMIFSYLDYAGRKNQNVACKKGCSWCCHQPVFALSYELAWLNSYLAENFEASMRKTVEERASLKRQKLSGLLADEILQSRIPCPLLENGICLTYPARPVACRIYLSTSLSSCLKFFNAPEDKNAVPALLYVPKRLGSMLNEGFKAALKIHGWQVEELRIDEGIGTGPQR